MNQAELANLANGVCTTKKAVQPQAVIVNTAETTSPSEICADPTQAVLLDANKISQAQCPTVFLDVTNNSGATATVVFGAFGNPNERFLNYESAVTPPSATDVAGMLDNQAPAAAANNFPGLQRFNYIVTRQNVIIKRIIVRLGTAPVAGQQSQNLLMKDYTIDQANSCNGRRISPACNTCFNNQDQVVITFEGPYTVSELKALWYNVLNTQQAQFEIELDAQASAKGFVPCVNG